MEWIYRTMIKPVLEGDVKKHIDFFRKLKTLKRNMKYLFEKTQMDEVMCNKIIQFIKSHLVKQKYCQKNERNLWGSY